MGNHLGTDPGLPTLLHFWQHFFLLNIYRKYYGRRMALFLPATFYAAMAAAGYVTEFLFEALNLIPDQHSAKLSAGGIAWNYTTRLNILTLIIAAALLARFLRTGGRQMLATMNAAPDNHPHATADQ